MAGIIVLTLILIEAIKGGKISKLSVAISTIYSMMYLYSLYIDYLNI